MRYEPLVSIITLTYNHENYIAECIESVLCQTYENWEMIILDDASTDRTPFIIEEYAKKDKRIEFIRNEKNMGMYNLDVNYNTALKEAKGEWIGYLEGDDVFTKRSLEYRIKALNELDSEEIPEIALVHGSAGRIWMDSEILDIAYNPFSHYLDVVNNNPVGSALKVFLQGINFIFPGSVLINKTKIDKIGGFKKDIEDAPYVDYHTWMHLTLEGRFLYLNKITYFWRRHSSSITMNYHEDLVKKAIISTEIFYSKNKDRIDKLNIDLNTDILKSCLGLQAKLELAKIYTLKRKYKEAKEYLRQINPRCFELLPIPRIYRIKYDIVRYANKLRAPFILDLSLKFKRQRYDSYLGKYKPFFFQELDI